MSKAATSKKQPVSASINEENRERKDNGGYPNFH